MQSNKPNQVRFVITFENIRDLTESDLKDTLHKMGQILLEDRQTPSIRECFIMEYKERKI